jgi:methylphosphotriester-DNA--protein-cysteine methyltransferase
MMFIYVDATRRIADVDAVAATTIARTATRMAADGETPIAMVRSCATSLGLDRKHAPVPRFAAAIAMLNMQPDRMRTVAQAADLSALSASHFQRKLRENYGVSFRAYRNWARMSFVMHRIKEGATLTNAALAAGFSSSAHFSERFRRMFGVSLSSLQRANGRIVTITDQ